MTPPHCRFSRIGGLEKGVVKLFRAEFSGLAESIWHSPPRRPRGISHGRQTRIRRYDRRGNQAKVSRRHASLGEESGQEDLASQPLAARALGAMAPGDTHALEAQGLEIEGLVLTVFDVPLLLHEKNQAPFSGAFLV